MISMPESGIRTSAAFLLLNVTIGFAAGLLAGCMPHASSLLPMHVPSECNNQLQPKLPLWQYHPCTSGTLMFVGVSGRFEP
jgi:hypothetical protein